MLRKISTIEKTQFVREDSEDIIRINVPLMIRLFEYIREENSTDIDLHKITEELIEYSKKHVVTMDDYYEIIDKPKETTTLTEKSTLFKMNSRSFWSSFIWSLLNYSKLPNNVEGLSEIENKIYKNASRIGEFVIPYYGQEVGINLSGALSEFAKIGVGAINDLKSGTPLTDMKGRWNQNIETIATFLSTINPQYWPKEAVKSYFDTLVQLWIDSISARESKDFVLEEYAIDAIEKLVSLGNSNTPSLADVFSTGIIAQYPEKFTD